MNTERAQAPGWYYVTAHACRSIAEPANSQLTDEALRLPPPRADGHVSAVVLLERALGTETFASANPALDIDGISLRPISRFEAAARMLLGIRDAEGRVALGSTMRVLSSVLSGLHGGMKHVGEAVARGYRASIRKRWDQIGLLTDSAPCLVRRFSGNTGLEWLPTNDLAAVMHTQDGVLWDATGGDPRFMLATAAMRPARVERGWYLMRAHVALQAGRITGPCLYPDYGNGASQESMIRLPEPDADGLIACLVLFKHDVANLRFDPTIAHATFQLRDSCFERVGRVRALWRMASAVAARESGRPHGWGTVRVLARFAKAACRVGTSEAAVSLRLAYEQEQSQLRAGYSEWVRRYDTLAEPQLRGLQERAARLSGGPLISVLLPVHETPELLLRKCLDSVLAQAYGHWELCVADDASTSAHVRETLCEYECRDTRIKVLFRGRNGHIAEASNSALSLASGEYVALLDHDDELRPHALLEMVEAIMASPGVELLYSDEDKLDLDGVRYQPYFKPDWNPDLLRSQNYLCHLSVIRTERVRAIGGFRKGFEGSQDHDLVLRCTENLPKSAIRHIPKVLYHWRAVAGSTALHRDAKDYASSAGARAVAEHLVRIEADAAVEELEHGHYRVRWHVPDPAPLVSIIIPTRDRVELLRACIDSIFRRSSYPSFEVIVVDNLSTEPDTLDYLERLRADGTVTVIPYNAPFNYSAINNAAVRQCRGELVCLLNNDIEVLSPDWLQEMVGHAMRPEVGVVGAMLYYPGGTIQHAGVVLGLGGVANHAYMGQPRGTVGHGARALVAQNLSAVTGACMMMRRALYLQLGGLDEGLQVAFNDIDFCLRAMSTGLYNVWTPFAELIHHESATRGEEDSAEKLARFHGEVRLMESRWGDLLGNDPAYNPNLSLDDMNCVLASPPRV